MRILRILGATLALGFIAAIFYSSAADLPPLETVTPETCFWLGAGLGLYIVSQMIGALAWRTVLWAYGVLLPAGRAESQLLVSQIGKYIPGNVAHIFGRLSLARTDGVAVGTTGLAMLLEVGVLLTTGLLLSGGLMLLVPEFRAVLGPVLETVQPHSLTKVLPLVLILGLLAGYLILWRKVGQVRFNVPTLAIPAVLHTLNFAVLGISLWCVTVAVNPGNAVDPKALIAVFTVAWVVGFLLPGAPGGIGIRDGIIALGLALFVGEGAALAIAVTHRAVATLGDALVFGIGIHLRRSTRKPCQTSVNDLDAAG